MQSRTFSRALPIGVVLVCVMIAIGCDRAPSSDDAAGGAGDGEGAPIRIVATTAMIADIVRNIAGEHGEVTALMGPGVDPHLFRPKRDDMNTLLDADVVFYNGLNLEGKMTDSFVQIARSGTPVYAVTEMIDESFLLAPEGFEGHHDPHVWMDVRGWISASDAAAKALGEAYPQHAESFSTAAAAYRAKLEALDDYARRSIASIPPERRVLITAHDAFNYFARSYDIEVMGIQGISTESEAGLTHIRDLVNTIVERRVPAIFTETSVSDKNIKALIEGAADQGHVVAIGGELFSDAMGPEGTYEGTYIGMIDHNVTTIARALGGEAPQKGLNGKLGSD